VLRNLVVSRVRVTGRRRTGDQPYIAESVDTALAGLSREVEAAIGDVGGEPDVGSRPEEWDSSTSSMAMAGPCRAAIQPSVQSRWGTRK
jgi:hypothetical protein